MRNEQAARRVLIHKQLCKLTQWVFIGSALCVFIKFVFSIKTSYERNGLWNRVDRNASGEVHLTKKFSVNYSEIMMRKVEVDRILSLLRNVDKYIEWGSGGSTLNYPAFVKKSSYSIEHNPSWCQHIRRRLDTHPHLSNVHYFCVWPSRTSHWNPLISRDGTYLNFRQYVDIIGDLNESNFDFVLIDGRARLPIAIKILSYISSASTVVLHDADRMYKSFTNYSKILRFYDLVDDGQSITHRLAVLRRKKQFDVLQGDHKAVQNILDTYSED